MNRDIIIAKVLKKLSEINTIDIKEMIGKIKDGTVPETSVPRFVYTFAERNRYDEDQRRTLMQYLFNEKVHKISPKHKQGMEYLRDKLFKFDRREFAF